MMRDNISEIIDNMAAMVEILTPQELDRIFKPITNINKALENMIRELDRNVDEYMLTDDSPQNHVYYVNNLFAKAQLQKITPKGANIKINPEVEIGTIIMVKKY